MRTRNSSPRRRGTGLSDVTRAGDTESTGAEQESATQGDEESGGGSDLAGPGDSDMENDDEDVKNDDEDVDNEGDDVENAGEEFDVENDAESDAIDDASDDGEVSVTVEAPSTWHADWGAWQAYFTLYCKRSMQVLPVKETMSRAERNRRLLKTKKGGNSSQLVPEAMDPYQRTYICTHGWKKRKSRSEGSRPRQHIRLTDCPFRFVIQWNMAKGELMVKNGCFTHNHPVSTAAFATYPTSRGFTDPIVTARVEGMLAVGAKRSRIYDYLLEHDQNVIQVDVDNLVRNHASSTSNVNDNDGTTREIAAFAAEDPENVSTVAETEAGESGVISLATAHMRRIYGRFSEVLLVDCSHKANRYNCQLLTFMGMNEFGEGAVVQQSLIEADGDWHMERAIAHFKRSHPGCIEKLRVIVVDKDLNEIRVLEEHFPDARVIICHFHVIKYLKEKRATPEFGKISSEDASYIDAAIHKMVYAQSEDQYDDAKESLHGICSRVGMDEFYEYFLKNWDSSQERWVSYLRSKLPHFKNHTNNRLESFFGKLKDSVDGSMSMAMCIKAIVAYDRRMQNEYEYRLSRIGRFVNSNYDEEMTNVLRFTTHYVAQQIEQQYSTAIAKLRRINTLILRHAIAYRKHAAVSGPLIPWSSIDERWTTPNRTLKQVRQFAYEKFSSTAPGSARKKMRTQSERYREAVRATHLIASEIADIQDDEEFDEMLNFVMTQWRNVRQRNILVGKSGTTNDISVCNQEELEDAAKREFDISSSENEGQTDGSVTIRLNPKAKKVGASRKLKKNTVAGEKEGRQWFDAAESGRKVAGADTLQDLLENLDRDKPGLLETQRRLSGVIVRHGEVDNKKPKLKVSKNPVLVQDPFYLLPSKLLDTCVKVLPLSNTKGTAISVDRSQSSQSQSVEEKDTPQTIETVLIMDVGQFSRKQIETFNRVRNLKEVVELGLDTYKWMVEVGIPALPAEHHALAKEIAEKAKNTYPYQQIQGLPGVAEFQYGMLYRVTPPTWLSDASIRALCLRLCQDYPECRFAGFQSTIVKTTRTRNTEKTVLSESVRDCVQKQSQEEGVESVFVPLNFGNLHWCCVVVKVSAKRICYYDPLNQASYMNAAKEVAISLKIAGLSDFDVIAQNNPIQFDGFSCGIIVCWMFIRQITSVPPQDMSDASLPRRRFELFCYLLTGKLLPAEAAANALTEEKASAPRTPDYDVDEEDVAPTQVAGK